MRLWSPPTSFWAITTSTACVQRRILRRSTSARHQNTWPKADSKSCWIMNMLSCFLATFQCMHGKSRLVILNGQRFCALLRTNAPTSKHLANQQIQRMSAVDKLFTPYWYELTWERNFSKTTIPWSKQRSPDRYAIMSFKMTRSVGIRNHQIPSNILATKQEDCSTITSRIMCVHAYWPNWENQHIPNPSTTPQSKKQNNKGKQKIGLLIGLNAHVCIEN